MAAAKPQDSATILTAPQGLVRHWRNLGWVNAAYCVVAAVYVFVASFGALETYRALLPVGPVQVDWRNIPSEVWPSLWLVRTPFWYGATVVISCMFATIGCMRYARDVPGRGYVIFYAFSSILASVLFVGAPIHLACVGEIKNSLYAGVRFTFVEAVKALTVAVIVLLPVAATLRTMRLSRSRERSTPDSARSLRR
jgi:hypothetical protein